MNPQGVVPQSAYPQAKPQESSSETRARDDAVLASITVSSRIPEFWADQPRLWFVQFEAAVASQKLSDAAKQNLVVTKLNKTAIQQVSDLLLSPPDSQKYDSLKDRLLQVFEESETRQFQKLLGEMELGSQKPSQLLRRMRELARGKIPDPTLQIMWNSHLPSPVQAVLAVTEVKDLENLAIVADKVIEASRPTEVAEIATHATRADSTTKELMEMIQKLSVDLLFGHRLHSTLVGTMGGGTSKDQVIAQATVNNSAITQKLDNMHWIIIAMVVVIGFAAGYLAWHRCKGSAKGWVRKQVFASNATLATVQTVPRQQSTTPQYAP